MKKEFQNYYLGLDIGTDSVGYAVTNSQYDLLRFHGEDAWGVTLFDAGSLKAKRRAFRTARRRLNRKKQRIQLLQELFATEIAKIDKDFFIRLQGSYLYRDEIGCPYTIFNDENYTDKKYHKEYPTIHHLIVELMKNPEPHDVRLVYLACSWLISHRGHFLSNIDVNHIENVTKFDEVYQNYLNYFDANGYRIPWQCDSPSKIAEILKQRKGVSYKKEQLNALLYKGKPSKKINEEDNFPFSEDAIVRLLSGGKVKPVELFGKDEHEEVKSFALTDDDDALAEVAAAIGDDFELIVALRGLFDWAVLVETLKESESISEAKVKVYEKHQADLKNLKYLLKKYNVNEYNRIFRTSEKGLTNYSSYVCHADKLDPDMKKTNNPEDFLKSVKNTLSNITPDPDDEDLYNKVLVDIDDLAFLPKQKNTDNRVIPNQLYLFELKKILQNAKNYLTFLNETDAEGYRTLDKIESIFSFRVPYYVGPLNKHSQYAWIVRKADNEKIYPWNFEKVVDLDASEDEFIRRLLNSCTYLRGEATLPKDSLLYHKYMVLNELNNIRINNIRISIELKQKIYNELFLTKKKVTKRQLFEFLISEGQIQKGEEETVTGLNDNIQSNLCTQIAFKRLLESGQLSEKDVEEIIERSTFAEDKTRLRHWLDAHNKFGKLSEDDKKYICSIKVKDFGRLSRKFLDELKGAEKESGVIYTIVSALWNTQNNLQELLSDKFTFSESIKEYLTEYYSTNPKTLAGRMDEMYLSNAVRRSVYRTLAVVKDVVKAFGCPPSKIFVEVTRGADEKQKGKKTKSRRDQILEFYKTCKNGDVQELRKQLEEMGDSAESKLQGDKLFLYYMQLGRCAYSGEKIELEQLGTKLYDIDHIYPQAFVKDDSILNNKVLCLSKMNGQKTNNYPIDPTWQKNMGGFWKMLNSCGLMTDEKLKRLLRVRPFTEEEKWQFINRQLTETSQSTKAVAELLQEKYPDSEVIHSKAGLVSDFRKGFEILKSRSFNDLHHAVDAYLNIVVGNVYDERFSKRWFSINSDYNIKVSKIFTHPLIVNGVTVWDGTTMLGKVQRIAQKQTAHFTKFAFFKHGGLFDQMPIKKSPGLTELKKGKDTERYGGYNTVRYMFYIPARYKAKKNEDICILPIEILVGEKFLQDENFAKEYAAKKIRSIYGVESDVTFPLGLKPWKVNTTLSLDGLNVCISGVSGGAKNIIVQTITQFKEKPEWQIYLKKLESFVEKCKQNKNYQYDKQYDKVSAEKNEELYELYISKLSTGIYSKRIANPVETLKKGKNKFQTLSVKDQSQALINIHQVFGSLSNGIDLTLIGGKKTAAATKSLSAKLSAWGKTYSKITLIDSSPSGLWYSESGNLLDLL